MTIPVPLFPSLSTLPGRSWSVHKTPTFVTLLPPATMAGREARMYQQQYPTWQFDLKFSRLKEVTQNQTPYAAFAGFTELQDISELFLWTEGRRGTFYFDDMSDDSRSRQYIATGDGNTKIFQMKRTLGPATTLHRVAAPGATILNCASIADLATGDIITISQGTTVVYTGPITQTGLINFPNDIRIGGGGILAQANAGAYVAHAASVLEPVGAVNTSQIVRVYFNDVQQSAGLYAFSGEKIVFTAPPDSGVNISADFSFYYLCRFTEDQHQYRQFMSNLWEFGSCKFRSVLQPLLTARTINAILTEITAQPILAEMTDAFLTVENP